MIIETGSMVTSQDKIISMFCILIVEERLYINICSIY